MQKEDAACVCDLHVVEYRPTRSDKFTHNHIVAIEKKIKELEEIEKYKCYPCIPEVEAVLREVQAATVKEIDDFVILTREKLELLRAMRHFNSKDDSGKKYLLFKELRRYYRNIQQYIYAFENFPDEPTQPDVLKSFAEDVDFKLLEEMLKSINGKQK